MSKLMHKSASKSLDLGQPPLLKNIQMYAGKKAPKKVWIQWRHPPPLDNDKKHKKNKELGMASLNPVPLSQVAVVAYIQLSRHRWTTGAWMTLICCNTVPGLGLFLISVPLSLAAVVADLQLCRHRPGRGLSSEQVLPSVLISARLDYMQED